MIGASENPGTTAVSVILPANNEAELIGGCLRALGRSAWNDPSPVQVIVVANGCQDDTADRARAEIAAFADRGWRLQVIDRPEGGKLAALDAGDAVAAAPVRVYLDADVTVSPALLSQLHTALSTEAPRYASGTVRITARGPVSRAYAAVWRRVPFMASGVPGCGIFAVNAAGRARWGAFPEIISDDTFVRLNFAPEERIRVPATYDWPIAEGFANLVKVRGRQDRGVHEIEQRFPELLGNDDKPAFPLGAKLALALRNPLAFAVYSGVAFAVRRRPAGADWSRSR
ncbi:glycosyltransferase [Salipiger pallidus]|uniref:glycosyltransferase n=1 Tax=Salipiger pallidus TaxID=1775170 RepID=UPI00166562A2|nr:glycosyltransferase [Salipiger pallidus]